MATVSRERFFDTNMTKTGLTYFLTGDTKNAHCAFDKYAGVFSDPVTYKKNDRLSLYIV